MIVETCDNRKLHWNGSGASRSSIQRLLQGKVCGVLVMEPEQFRQLRTTLAFNGCDPSCLQGQFWGEMSFFQVGGAISCPMGSFDWLLIWQTVHLWMVLVYQRLETALINEVAGCGVLPERIGGKRSFRGTTIGVVMAVDTPKKTWLKLSVIRLRFCFNDKPFPLTFAWPCECSHFVA